MDRQERIAEERGEETTRRTGGRCVQRSGAGSPMDVSGLRSQSVWVRAFGVFAGSVLALAAMGCTRLPKPDFEPAVPHLNVVTYNVNWGCPRPDRVTAFLASEGFDVVCLQETHEKWQALLEASLGSRYPHTYFEHGRGAGGIAILSRHPLRIPRPLPPAAGWFPALLADVETPLGTVQVLNVHLRPKVSDNGSVTVSALYYSPAIHREEIDSFLEATNPDVPLIIAGDFNESESGGAADRLVENGFSDALSLFDRRSKTWEWPLAFGASASARFDHVFFRPPLVCTGSEVRRVKASDHMPVVATVILVPAER